MANWTTRGGKLQDWAVKLILDQECGPGDPIMQSSVTTNNDDDYNCSDIHLQGRLDKPW
jgi:hypothetical protein